MESLIGLKHAKTLEERDKEAKERLAKYKDDDRYICVEDDGEVIVAEKFTDEDWKKVEDMIDSHPLFSRSFDDVQGNEMLQALQAIKYDEDAETILENLYKEANQAMKDKLIGKQDKHRFLIKKCLEIYSDALSQNAQCLETRAKILSNRALLHMWAKNYGKAISDSMDAIQISPTFIRPYVRACESLLRLDKYEKCIRLADKGLQVEFLKELKEIRDEAVKKLDIETEKLRQKQSKKQQANSTLLQACESAGLTLGPVSDYPLPTVYSVDFILYLEDSHSG